MRDERSLDVRVFKSHKKDTRIDFLYAESYVETMRSELVKRFRMPRMYS